MGSFSNFCTYTCRDSETVFTANFFFHCKVSALSLQSFGLFTAKSFCSAAKFRFFFCFTAKCFSPPQKNLAVKKKVCSEKGVSLQTFFFSLQSHFAPLQSFGFFTSKSLCTVAKRLCRGKKKFAVNRGFHCKLFSQKIHSLGLYELFRWVCM